MSIYGNHILPRILHLCASTKLINEQRANALKETGGVVLEIGFGSGLNLPFYSKRVKRLMAVEPSLTARKLAVKAISEAPFPVEFAGLDGQSLALPDASVDQVVSTLTLCTIPDPEKALKEIARVLKPGGMFIFMEHGHAPDASVAKWQDRLNGIQQTIMGGCNLNREIDKLIRSAPLKLEKLNNFYFEGMPRPMAYTYQGHARKKS
jgi:ubiquinone/menaquinone biosynthesis C-methylase UbiE